MYRKKTINKPKYFPSLLLSMIVLLSVNLFAQSDTENKDKKFNNWNITASGGTTLMWCDISDEMSNPLAKYFSDQQGWAGGLMLSRRLSKSFTVNLEYTGGFFQGYKLHWSNGGKADIGFKSKFHDINLNVESDLLNLFFEKKDYRLIAPYLKVGVGYVFYNATKYHYSDNSDLGTFSGSTLNIPWGWGLRFDLTKHWSLHFENTFHHAKGTNGDLVDGHGTELYSRVDDIWAYTSLGITYRIFQSPKKPKMPKEEEIEEIDTAIAKVIEDVEPSFDLSIKSSIPSSLHPYDTSNVIIEINKGPITGGAKLQQTFPDGFIIKEGKNDGADFKFNGQILSYTWEELPTKKTLQITYLIITKGADIKKHNIPGIIFYNQDDIEQITQFKKSLEIKALPVVAETTEVNETTETKIKTDKAISTTEITSKATEIETDTPVSSENKNKNKNKQSLIYRVQVYAVYGGTTSGILLKKRLGLDYDVKQDYQGKYAKYTSGEFATYEEAAAYKKKLRNSTVPGAFVVGFYEGERTKNITQAISIENGQEMEPSNANIPDGRIFRIQIMASSRNLSNARVSEITGYTGNFNKVTHNGLYKYEVGNYRSFSQAKVALKEIRNTVSDAFLVKYINGVR